MGLESSQCFGIHPLSQDLNFTRLFRLNRGWSGAWLNKYMPRKMDARPCRNYSQYLTLLKLTIKRRFFAVYLDIVISNKLSLILVKRRFCVIHMCFFMFKEIICVVSHLFRHFGSYMSPGHLTYFETYHIVLLRWAIDVVLNLRQRHCDVTEYSRHHNDPLRMGVWPVQLSEPEALYI